MVRARHNDLPRIEERNLEYGLGWPILRIAVLDDLSRVGNEADGADV